jgi:hypothetical protein
MHRYLFFLLFNSVSFSLQETKKTSVIFFILRVFYSVSNINSIDQPIIPFDFYLSWFTWTFLMEYSRGKLERNGKKI